MNEQLAAALATLLRGQDSDSVNELFGSKFCGTGESASVDLIRGEVRVFNNETDDLVRTVRFKISIDEI